MGYLVFLKILKLCVTLIFQVKVRYLCTNEDVPGDRHETNVKIDAFMLCVTLG